MARPRASDYDTPVITPLTLSSLTPRGLAEIAAAAHAVQANVVALRVAWCKRTGQAGDEHDIRTPPPGAVRANREMLIDWRIIKDYSAEEVLLRLRQVWGEFCALCWLFPFVDPQAPVDFEHLPPDQDLRCLGEIHDKLATVQSALWRLRHEQTFRTDADARSRLDFQREREVAISRPMQVYGQHIDHAPDADILCCACEHAGMLAALRWATDNRWTWEGPGIMDVAPRLAEDGPRTAANL